MLQDKISRCSEGFFNGALKLGWQFAPASTRVIGPFLRLMFLNAGFGATARTPRKLCQPFEKRFHWDDIHRNLCEPTLYLL